MDKPKLKTPKWEPGQPVEFKHVAELSSRLSVRDAGILGSVWNNLSTARGKLRKIAREETPCNEKSPTMN